MWNDLKLVEQFGAHLDSRANDETIRDLMIKGLLKIRVKKGGVNYLKLNRAQENIRRGAPSGTLC